MHNIRFMNKYNGKYALKILVIIIVVVCYRAYIAHQNKKFHSENLAYSIERKQILPGNDLNLRQEESLIQNKLSIKADKNDRERAVILVWTTSAFIEAKGIEFNATEKYGSCRVTMDRSTLKQSAAVVIFNNNKYLEKFDLPNPKTRIPDQVYAFWTTETPAKTVLFKSLLENPLVDSIFNLSMSLMRTADIQLRFGSHRSAVEATKRWKYTTDKSSSLWKKTKLAIWAVSNCHRLPGSTERLIYAKSLVKAGLKLDKFGECFQQKWDESRLITVVQSYKFYLAFENSLHCPDYVSEKFWRNSIKAGLVPIVWGPTKEDVLRVAPPYSFIHAEDYTSPKDLVDYLNYLDQNYTAYMEFHKWRDASPRTIANEKYAVDHVELLSMLCQRLVLESHPPKSIPSISKLLYETNYPDNKCLRKVNTYSEQEQKEATNF